MTSVLKITSGLASTVLTDLSRYHAFAFERTGLLLCRDDCSDGRRILYAFDYHPIPDEMYIQDDSCGARINGDAIRLGMTLAVRHDCSVLHVHTHGNVEKIVPSSVDLRELPGLARSFANAHKSKPHGWIILSPGAVEGEVLYKGECNRLSDYYEVGVPLKLPHARLSAAAEQRRLEGASNEKHTRQSFLGPDSTSLIRATRIGIVGLGGGGSHVVQQLAHLGFMNYVLCDNDRVSTSNLNRLVGATREDARKRRYKSHVAKRVITGLEREANVMYQPARWQDLVADLKQCDLIFGCVDSFSERKQLEDMCRRYFIPYIDIGMDVRLLEHSGYEIYGQVCLSLPGHPCLQCTRVITDDLLDAEVQRYGDAGGNPQVVWSNGVLASNAVGIAMELLTGWSKQSRLPCRLDYRGSSMSTGESEMGKIITGCKHYPLSASGKPVFIPI